MNATARIAVLKFGGTSVATREQRLLAFGRVRDARDAGFATVAVVSAMGRSPSRTRPIRCSRCSRARAEMRTRICCSPQAS